MSNVEKIKYVIFLLGVVLVMALLGYDIFYRFQNPIVISPTPYDDTDRADGTRSGFELMTDYGTGCQYLKSGNTLTVRLNTFGQPMCGGTHE